MRYLCLLFLLLCFLSIPAFAQRGFHIGVVTGVNNTYVLDKGLKEDPRFLATGTYKFSPIGIATGLDLGNSFGLQFEALLAKAGQFYDVVDVNNQKIGERSMEYDYLSMPFLIKIGGGQGNKVEFNVLFGPQLSLLTSGLETLQYESGTIIIPEGGEVPQDAINNGDGTYTVPAFPETVIASDDPTGDARELNDTDVQLVFDMGVRIMLNPNLYINTDIRGNYGLIDMRSDELIQDIKNKRATFDSIFGRRANLLVGLQLGLNYYLPF